MRSRSTRMLPAGLRPGSHGGVVLAVVLAAVLTVSACGGGKQDKTAGTASGTTLPATATSGASSRAGDVNPDQLPVFISIDTCDNQSGTGTSTGTIENQSSAPASYRFELDFTDASSGAVLGTGSYVTGSVAPGASTNYVVSAGSLGGAELTCRTKSIRRADGGAATATATGSGTAGALAEGFPCNVMSADALKALTGNALEGDATTNHVVVNDLEWTAKTCTWTAPGVSNPTEVTLNVSLPADFASGEAECPAQSNGTKPVSGLGDKASWSWNDPGTTITTGKLRVCSSVALIDVDVSGAGGEATLQKVAKGVAGATLTKL